MSKITNKVASENNESDFDEEPPAPQVVQQNENATLKDNDTPVPAKKPATKAKAKTPAKETLPIEPSVLQAIAAADMDSTELNSAEMQVFSAFLHCLKDTPYHYEAIAASRLALLGNVSKLLHENAALSSVIANVCERFDVYVTSTNVANGEVHEARMPVLRDGKYDAKTLQLGLLSLVTRFNSIVAERDSAKSLLQQDSVKIERLTEDVRRHAGEAAKLREIPQLPKIVKPFVISSLFSKKDEKPLQRYICKDEELGYTSKPLLAQAMRFGDLNKAAELLVYLNDKQSEYPIRKIHAYSVMALHYSTVPYSNMDTETNLRLVAAQNRAKENDK